jgi:RNA polymerase sigma-70 factor, ECF subfamily
MSKAQVKYQTLSGEDLLDETVLVRQARHGDQAAWITLVSEHQEVIFRLAYLILGDADEAQDVAQETFIRAFKSLQRFDESRPLRPWLLRIASNLSRNQRRSWGRYWAALTRFGHADLDRQTMLFEISSNSEETRMLWEAIQRLRKEDQEVIYMRYFLDLSVEEAAEVLKVAPGTVKSRMHRSLERLKAVIAQDFPGLREEQAI